MFLNKLKKYSIKRYNQLVNCNKSLKLKISKGDLVRVIAGDDKGKEGVVISILKKKMCVKVSGVNIVKKTTKNKEKKDENFIFVESPIHISNVLKLEKK